MNDKSLEYLAGPSGMLYDFFPWLHSIYEGKSLKMLKYYEDETWAIFKKHLDPIEVLFRM